MTYEEFLNQVREQITGFLPGIHITDVQVNKVIKQNDMEMDSLNIFTEGRNTIPSIYLNEYYEMLKKGYSMWEILDQIAGVFMDHYEYDFSISNIEDYKWVGERITCRLICAEENQHYLSDKPYQMMGDLAVTYHILIGQGRGGTMSIPLTHRMMQNYGISKDELHRQALENLKQILPPKFEGLNDMISGIIRSNPDVAEVMYTDPGDGAERAIGEIYILTNSAAYYGAAEILNTELMDEVERRVGEFYIIPSSVHEVLIIPKSFGMDVPEMESMVREVNGDPFMVPPEAKLSDHVYKYDSKSHTISLADPEEEGNVIGKEPAEMAGKKVEEKGPAPKATRNKPILPKGPRL